MRVSKPAVAREWLIFLAAFPLGFPACFFLGYYWENFPNDAFDAFWNDAFGLLGNVWSLTLWFVPYLALTVLRSIWWSITTLSPRERVKPSRLLSQFLILCLMAIVSFGVMFGVVVFNNAQRAAAARASEIRHFDPATLSLVERPQKNPEKESLYDKLVAYLEKKQKQLIRVEIAGKGIVEFPTEMSRDEIAATIKRHFFSAKFDPTTARAVEDSPLVDHPWEKAPVIGGDTHRWERAPLLDLQPVVATADLKKITLFDVGPKKYSFADPDGNYSIRGFYGRIRSELPFPVEGIVIRVSIYNAAGQLIEVKDLSLSGLTVAPSAPVSFDRGISFDHLPRGYSYRVEIIEAVVAVATGKKRDPQVINQGGLLIR